MQASVDIETPVKYKIEGISHFFGIISEYE